MSSPAGRGTPPILDDGLVFGYVSLRHSATAIARSALAYSNVRLMWWRLAFLDLPMLWLLNAVSVVLHPARLITRTCAIALCECADGADEHRAGSLALLALIVADLGIVLLGPLILVASVTTPGWVATAAFAWTFLLIVVPTLTYRIPALVQHVRGRGLKHWCATTDTRPDEHR